MRRKCRGGAHACVKFRRRPGRAEMGKRRVSSDRHSRPDSRASNLGRRPYRTGLRDSADDHFIGSADPVVKRKQCEYGHGRRCRSGLFF